jgi:serine/threonine-protein kinase RsbW
VPHGIGGKATLMELALNLRLPRDRMSVSVARHVVRHAVEELGVDADCAHDIELALSEACTNVLLHSGPGEEYDVRLELADERCEIQVVDVGRGFDHEGLPPSVVGSDAERGRGLLIMTALVDRLRFRVKPPSGTIVRMEKDLVYADRSLLGQ